MGIIGTEVFNMDVKNLKDKINRLEQKIKALPQGSIGKKNIKNTQFYSFYFEKWPFCIFRGWCSSISVFNNERSMWV